MHLDVELALHHALRGFVHRVGDHVDVRVFQLDGVRLRDDVHAMHVSKVGLVDHVLAHVLIVRTQLPALPPIWGPRFVVPFGDRRDLPLWLPAFDVVPDHDDAVDLPRRPCRDVGFARKVLGVGNPGTSARAIELPCMERADDSIPFDFAPMA